MTNQKRLSILSIYHERREITRCRGYFSFTATTIHQRILVKPALRSGTGPPALRHNWTAAANRVTLPPCLILSSASSVSPTRCDRPFPPPWRNAAGPAFGAGAIAAGAIAAGVRVNSGAGDGIFSRPRSEWIDGTGFRLRPPAAAFREAEDLTDRRFFSSPPCSGCFRRPVR